MLKPNMVMSPEAEEPAGGGVSEPEAPAGGNEPDPVEPDREESLDPGTQPDEPQVPRYTRQQRGDDNRIPYSRVQQMLQQAEQRGAMQAQEILRRQVAPLLEQLDPVKQRRAIVDQMMRSMGQEPKPEPPKYLTREEAEQLLSTQVEQLQQQREQDQEQRRIQEDTSRAAAGLERAKAKHAAYFAAMPELEDDIINDWGTPSSFKAGKTVEQIADAKVAAIRKAMGKLNQSVAEAEAETAPVAPIRPGSSPRPVAPRKGADLSSDEGIKKAALAALRAGQG